MSSSEIAVVYILIGLFLLGLLVGLVWRRRALPCPSWLSWVLENPFNRGAAAWTSVLRLDVQPGMRVLDAGCGPGRVTIPLARQVGPEGHVTALDIQSGMLKQARERAVAARLTNIRFLQAPLGEAGLERGHYDRAALITVLGEIRDRRRALKEIFDALKLGGILSVSEIILDPHFQSRASILRLAESIGFRQREAYGSGLSFTLNLQKPFGEQGAPQARPRRGLERHALLI